MSKAVFLDRDGVINRKAPEGDYVIRWEEMTFLPGVVDAISLLNKAGFRVIVVTNQRCVAKGLITAQALESLHQQMCNALARDGARIDAVYYCPHEKDAGCGCRKPAPGMLLKAKADYGIDLSPSWMIGDSELDVEAGMNAGCKTARLWLDDPIRNSRADVVADFLLEATHKILQLEKAGSSEDSRKPDSTTGVL
jgi:D-glycero-D-manno-heptose 1,7-bisphosphate phosphatase